MPRFDTRMRDSPGEHAAREISYHPDDANDWSGDGPVDVAEALDETAALATKNKTITRIIYIEDPKATDSFPMLFIPDDITMVQVRSVTDIGTVDFNIERRATNTPDVAGTDVCDTGGAADPDLRANAAGTGDAVTTTFAAAGAVAAEQWLNYNASAVATNPAKLWVALEYTID